MPFNYDKETTIPHNARPEFADKSELVDLVRMIDFAKQNGRLHESLYQLHKNGPVWDGNVICKSDRDMLLYVGACSKVVVKGEDGFNACTYTGMHLLSIYDWLYGSLKDHRCANVQRLETGGGDG